MCRVYSCTLSWYCWRCHLETVAIRGTYFLMISGYFAYQKDEIVVKKKRLQKALKIFLVSFACFFAYNALLSLASHSFTDWIVRNFNLSTPIKYVVFCTINFAIVLWYLIAMIETYVVWYFVVKFKKNNCYFG